MSLAKLLKEAARRGLIDGDHTAADGWDELVNQTTEDVESKLCDKQLSFIRDDSTYVAACAGRQSGKNHTVSRLLILTALRIPNAECVYVNATFREGRSIMWASPTDGLGAVLRDLGLREGTDFWLNQSLLRADLANGSYIQVLGADRGAWAKLRGNRYNLIVIDECQKLEEKGFETGLRSDLPGTIVAKRGRIVLIGMPNEFATGVFHDICERAADPESGRILWPQFSLHTWDASDNDLRPDIWDNIIRDRDLAGLTEDDPAFLREFRARWLRVDASFVLPLTPLSIWDGKLPQLIPSRTPGILLPRSQDPTLYGGLDWGYTDAFAIVIVSVAREEGVIREVHSEKHTGLDIKQKSEVIKGLMGKYPVTTFYADNASPADIVYCRRQYNLPVVPCDKSTSSTKGQAFYVSAMRAALRSGNLQILNGSPLHKEIKALVPDPDEWKNQRIKPLPGSEDHAYDSLRYVFRGIWDNHPRSPEVPLTDAERRKVEQQAQKNRLLGIKEWRS